MEHFDPISLAITAAMVAVIRLIDAWIAGQAGVPGESLRPTPVADLDAEAQRYVDQIVSSRRQPLLPG